MIRTLLIPGLDGSFAPHWQHWWEGVDPAARMVTQQDWVHPDRTQWLSEIAGALLLHPGAVLVGHSLGAVAVVQLLTRWPQLKVGGAMLVAPALPEHSARTAGFGTLPEQRLPVPVIVAASRNDAWMPQPRARALARIWGADFVDMGMSGHINPAAGFGPWPRGRALRARLDGAMGPQDRAERA